MSKQHKTPAKALNPNSDWVWGAEAIGIEINQPRSKVYRMIARGDLDSAIRRFGHRTIAASRTRLRELIAGAE
jgi:hypothetical protein